MKRETHRLELFVALALTALVALLTGPGVWADSGSQALEVEGVSVKGNLISVTLSNPSADTASAKVSADALLLDGSVQHNEALVTLIAGESVTMTLGYSAPVVEAMQVGIEDGLDPIG